MKKNKDIVVSPKKTASAALKELHNEKVKTPEEVAAATSKAIANFKPGETFDVIDPITKEVRTVSLSRTGTQEADLIVALANPDLKRDQKDYALSMYLWGRGAESTSMIVDLMRYKGTHTKETRVFKSQIRFDFEALVSSFIEHLENQARNTAQILGINLQEVIGAYRTWLKDSKSTSTSYADFAYWKKNIFTKNEYQVKTLDLTERLEAAMISNAIFQLDEAEKLTRARQNIALAREREKGGGIFVDSKGRVYDDTNPDFDKAVEEDRKATADIENE